MTEIILWVLLISCASFGIFIVWELREERRQWKEFFSEIRKHRKKTVRLFRNN